MFIGKLKLPKVPAKVKIFGNGASIFS